MNTFVKVCVKSSTCYCNLGGMTFVFFAKILIKGYEPNVITLTTLMKGMCLMCQAQKALYSLGHLVAHGFRLDQVS